jgi:hypothetical protein
MSKNTTNAKLDEIKGEAIENIENVALENVTGGCSRCGCEHPDGTGSQEQLRAPTWLP